MITFNLVNKNIIGSINGENFSVPYDKDTWESMVKASSEFANAATIEQGESVIKKFKGLTLVTRQKSMESITEDVKYNPTTGTYHLTHNGVLSPVPLPQVFVDKLIFADDNNLPVDPLIKLMVRAFRNPHVHSGIEATAFLERLFGYVFETFVDSDLMRKFTEEGYSDEIAAEMATVPQTPITQEGLLCTKKVVTPLYDRQRYRFELDEDGNPKKVLRSGVKEIDEDTGDVSWNDPQFAEDWIFEPYIMGKGGDAFFCGSEDDSPTGHIIKVGYETRLPDWSYVNTNNNASCVKGLEVCGLL